MEITLGKNIRALRKERKFTQEQLSEALGVTVGAVSKWESGACTPDISLIIALARFFETSVDVLLGYEWRSGGVKQTQARILTLRDEKRFDEALAEMDRALLKFPNVFDIVYQGAVLHSLAGVERKDKALFRRALTLFERSLDLVGQKSDDEINEQSIKTRIADVYVALGQPEDALAILKKNNVCGVNNIRIGEVLARAMNKPDEALRYLSEALFRLLFDLQDIMVSYAAAYADKRDYKAVNDAMRWIDGALAPLELPGATSYITRLRAQFMTSSAAAQYKAGDAAGALESLRAAKTLAERFDEAPDYHIYNVRFFHSETPLTGFDDFGDTTMRGVERVLREDKDAPEALLNLWHELTCDTGGKHHE